MAYSFPYFCINSGFLQVIYCACCLLHVDCLAYSAALKVKVVCSSETLTCGLPPCYTVLHPRRWTLHNQWCENYRSHKFQIVFQFNMILQIYIDCWSNLFNCLEKFHYSPVLCEALIEQCIFWEFKALSSGVWLVTRHNYESSARDLKELFENVAHHTLILLRGDALQSGHCKVWLLPLICAALCHLNL